MDVRVRPPAGDGISLTSVCPNSKIFLAWKGRAGARGWEGFLAGHFNREHVMKLTKFAAALVIGSSLLTARAAFAAEKEAKPAAGKPAAAEVKGDAKGGEAKPGDKPGAASTVKLVKPWSDLTTLTEEQKQKIDAIHKKALAETSVINKKEKDDITALLTDAQKAELKELSSKAKKATAATPKKDGAGDTEKKPEKKPDAK
jgi:hypothetical protein